jgi:HlyD family secretion protein
MKISAGWLFVAALALTTASCGNSSDASGPVATPATPANTTTQPAAPPAPAKPAEPAEILSVLSVEHQVDVPTQTDGVVSEVMAEEGASVKAGDILARLEDRSLQAELEKAQAELKVAENNVKYQEAEVKAKEAAYKRQQLLRENGLSSQADLEHAEFEATGSEYDLASWKAGLDRAKAEVRRLENELDKTRIRAPFAGMVVHRYIRVGQGLNKTEKCFRVSQLAPLRVQFHDPDTSSRRPHTGDDLQVVVTNDSGRAFPARVIKVSPTVDPASDSYDVTAQLTGSGLSDLRPGMAVRVDWPGSSHRAP